MYKSKGYRKLGRTSDHRKALLRNLTTDVIMKEEIITTEEKAKEVRRTVEKMITLGKKGDDNAKRRAASYLRNVRSEENGKTAVGKLFEDVAPRYADRNGGYTRITKLGNRRGDNAALAKIELV
ncbi:50S ribosomal protein L17 [Mollicutes bacterium LVI A0039]|nr:50S ribosomal protein L17 [Mollicutes bacterium LVI A0039]